jgi:hypothetical protein
MRVKRTYHVLTFHTTAAAMAMEQFCQSSGIPGRLIPVPREISAGCGLAWRITPEDFPQLQAHLSGEKGDRLTVGDFEIEIENRVTLLL